jgi:type IV pilus assembly protein PilM
VFKQAKWLAVIQDNHWLVAKVKKHKQNLKIIRISEFNEEMDLSLRQWLLKEKVPLKHLNIAFSCPGVITRMITLPLLSRKDLDELLTEQVDQYFTLNIKDYIVDYRIVGIFEEDGRKRQQILLAALPRYQWELLWNILQEAGVKPKAVDLAADCLSRLYGKGQSLTIEDMAIINLDRERIEFVLLEKGLFFLYADTQLSLEELRQMPVGMQEVESNIMPVLRTLEEFMNFFAVRHFGKQIDHIYLTGEYADLPNLQDIFQVNLEIETSIGFPGGWQAGFGKQVQEYSKNWMKYGSLYGLALRED